MTPDPLRDTWQAQEVEGIKMSIQEIRRRAEAFQRSIRRRNLREYASIAVATAAFVWFAWQTPLPLARYGFLAGIAGNLYVAYRLYRDGQSASVPADLGVLDGVRFHLGELRRQARVYRGRRARILAFVPAIVLIVLGAMSNKPRLPLPPSPFPPYLPFVSLLTVWMVAFYFLKRQENRTIAAIEREIQELESL